MSLEQTIYKDNVDPDLFIDDKEWYVKEARVELTTSKIPDFAEGRIVPTDEAVNFFGNDPLQPVTEGGLLGSQFVLNVENDIAVGDRSTNILPLFTGNVALLSPTGMGDWKFEAFDPTHEAFANRAFMNAEIQLTEAVENNNDPSVVIGDNTDYSEESSSSPPTVSIQASSLAEEILQQAGLSFNEYQIRLKNSGFSVGGGEQVFGVDQQLRFSENTITVKKALEQIRLKTNSEYWFDRFNKFYIGAPQQGSPIDVYTLQLITNTTAGKQTPAYRSVQIIGSGVASSVGWQQSQKDGKREIVSAASDEFSEKDAPQPIFRFRDMSILSIGEAIRVRNRILEDLKKQQSGGKVTVVGMPDVRPYDAIEMPNSKIQPMGGERYGVSKVVHKLNTSDGFLTDIHVGGVRRSQNRSFEKSEEERDRPKAVLERS